jgi:hypothetical protein
VDFLKDGLLVERLARGEVVAPLDPGVVERRLSRTEID